MLTEDAYSFGHLFFSHLLLVETYIFPEFIVIFPDCYSNIPRYFLDFALVKDHWWGFIAQNARIVLTVNSIQF